MKGSASLLVQLHFLHGWSISSQLVPALDQMRVIRMEKKKQSLQPYANPDKESKGKLKGAPIKSFLFSLLSCTKSGLGCADGPRDIRKEAVAETSTAPRKSENALRRMENPKGVGRVEEKLNHQNLNEISPVVSEHGSNKNIIQKEPETPLPEMSDPSCILPEDFCKFLYSALPMQVRNGCQWMLLYSTWKHGISLLTLYRNSAQLSGPCLLVAVDNEGTVFGGMLSCPLKPTSNARYQGTNDTFVFTNVSGKPELFRPTGVNRYFFLCSNDSLAFGGGGCFALYFHEDLLEGTSGPSETFGNCCLAKSGEFVLKHVELWGFVHASKYLSHRNTPVK